MKKIKFLVLGLVAMFMTLNVNAEEVTDLTGLKTCLAGTEATCTVKDAITLTGSINETLNLNNKTIVLEKFITVDGNATLTIEGKGTVSSNLKTCLFFVKNGGTLVVKDGTYNVTTANGMVFFVQGTETDNGVNTTLTIEEDVKMSANYGITVGHAGSGASYGVVVNYAGDFQGVTGNNGYTDGSIGITTNGYINKTDGNIPEINITGGSIKVVEGTTGTLNKDDAPAIYAGGYAIWNISDVTIEGSEALSIKSGKFNITSGTYKAIGKYTDPATAYNNGSEATGAALSVTANTGYPKNVEITIVDGTFESTNGHALYEGNTSDTETAIKTLLIEGGEFVSKDTFAALEVKNVANFVKGGTYSSEVETEYLVTNPVVEQRENNDGTYLVDLVYDVDVTVTGNGEVVANFERAMAGDTITLTVTEEDGYELTELTVTDADGKDVTVTDNKFVMPEGAVVVEATFEQIMIAPVVPSVDETKDVTEVEVGVSKDNTEIEDVLVESVEGNDDLADVIANTPVDVEIAVEKVNEEKVEEEVVTAIKDKAGNATIAEYFDINVLVKDANDGALLGNLNELTKEIELTVLLPEELRNTDESVNREYFVLREHNGTVEKISAKLSKDGKSLVFKSKLFSTYALAYQDTKNPQTGDNVMMYVIMTITAAAGLVIVTKKSSLFE